MRARNDRATVITHARSGDGVTATPATLVLAAAKLAESGLTLDDAARLGIDTVEPDDVECLMGVRMPAIRFCYHGLDGAPRADVFRLRVLGPPPQGAFGQVEAPSKYWQPKGSPVAVYLPQNVPMTWAQIAASTDVPIVITEGELKASAACKAGVITLALGGVWSWCNRREGTSFLPDLEAFAWNHRTVTLCFDSDATRNHHIAQATAALVGELRDRGAEIAVAGLPDVCLPGKTGLDDFLVARGVDALREVLNGAEAIDDLGIKLLDMNGKFAYIAKPGKLVWDAANNLLVPSDAFREIYGNIKATKVAPGPPPTGQRRQLVRLPDEWIGWGARRTFDAVTYEPGQGRILNGVPGHYRLNKWNGWAIAPAPGDVGPWSALIDHLFRGAPPLVRRWFECWCACPIQRPGTKLMNAVGIWSRRQGQGKSLVGETLKRIYGDNYIMITEKDLEGSFNPWAEGRQFVMVDDMTGHDSRDKADLLKSMITRTEMIVNIKFVPQYVLPDVANYYMTSNRPNAFYIDQEDRRFFIHEVVVSRLDQEFYDLYWDWLRADGPAALLHHFQTMDLGDFSPYLPPPVTDAKLDMVAATRTDSEAWIAELRADPASKLRLGDVDLTRDLFTARELMAFYEQDRHGYQPSVTMFSNALGEHFRQAHGGRPVKIDGRLVRLWIVRDDARWAEADVDAIVAHVREARKLEGGGAKF